ncbi:diacylglycerol/lipid kinase family protein [Brevibacillus sp. 179-C9.3 HS]|uniref:diacylglycerol/lipid kinase family protein n=1 Tax=unclassified Brevibacillus TaxID=2684853 RepID=UPI0039A08468
MLGVIVNPVSGNGTGLKVWRQMEPNLRRLGSPFQIRLTSGEGDAEKLSKELIQKEGVNKIIAVGGDGTVRGVINGIYESKQDCRFGLIPAGSGNDFARGHGIPMEPLQALDRILSGKEEKQIDLILLNGKVAVNSVGAGFDAQVAQVTDRAVYKAWLNRYKLGALAYILSVIRVVCTYQPCDIVLYVDGQEVHLQGVWLVVAANIPNYGGGMLICPDAVPNDGIAEICVVRGVSRLGLLAAFPKIFTGAHANHPGVLFYRGKEVTIQAEGRVPVHADGELVATTPIRVQMIEKCLTICV